MNIYFESFSKKKREEIDALAPLLSNNKKEKITDDSKGMETHARSLEDARESILDMAALNQRNLLKSQVTMDGLEKIAFLLEGKRTPLENEKLLTEIIATTRFQDDKVLAEYKESLYQIVQSADVEKLSGLIAEQKQKLLGLTVTENIAQNILSAGAIKPSKEYDLLLKEVVNQIKSKGGTLEFNVKREKVLDLLSE